MKNSFHLLQGLVFGGSLLLIGGLSLNEYRNYQPQEESWITGGQASAYETYYNDQLPIKSFAINLWAAIEYVAFNEGRQGVEIGTQGWLFSSEEFKSYAPKDDYTTPNLKKIKDISNQLSEQNIELVIAVIPAKTHIYPEYLGDIQPAQSALERYKFFGEWLQAQSIHWTGFKAPMLEAKERQQVYLRTDTHWTPNGAKVAAQHLGQYIASLDNSYVGSTEQFSTTINASLFHEGDLMSFIPVRDYFQSLGPQPETLTPQVTKMSVIESEENSDSLLFADDPYFDITLVGTSYSANELWNFPGALEQQLGQEILNYAEEGQGPIEPMETYLSSDDFKNTPPRLVIWEFPERYLPVKRNPPPIQFKSQRPAA